MCTPFFTLPSLPSPSHSVLGLCGIPDSTRRRGVLWCSLLSRLFAVLPHTSLPQTLPGAAPYYPSQKEQLPLIPVPFQAFPFTFSRESASLETVVINKKHAWECWLMHRVILMILADIKKLPAEMILHFLLKMLPFSSSAKNSKIFCKWSLGTKWVIFISALHSQICFRPDSSTL